jgi:hypothetical protein
MVAGFTDDLDLDDFKTSVVVQSSDDDDVPRNVSAYAVEAEPRKVKSKAAKNLFNVPLTATQLAPVSTDEESEPKKKAKKKKSKKSRASKSPSRERDDLGSIL